MIACSHHNNALPAECKQIEVGARVKSVLLPREQRTGEVNDFAFVLI